MEAGEAGVPLKRPRQQEADEEEGSESEILRQEARACRQSEGRLRVRGKV